MNSKVKQISDMFHQLELLEEEIKTAKKPLKIKRINNFNNRINAFKVSVGLGDLSDTSINLNARIKQLKALLAKEDRFGIVLPVNKPEKQNGSLSEFVSLKKIIRSGNYDYDDLLQKIALHANIIQQGELSAALNEMEILRGITEGLLEWEVLPAEELAFERLKRYFTGVENSGKFDLNRLEILEQLKPVKIWKGKGNYKYYLVYEFNGTQSVVLECPIVGNALYILKENWIQLSKKTKQELRTRHRHSVIRMVHHDINVAMIATNLGISKPANYRYFIG
jgi:hypothetical protein